MSNEQERNELFVQQIEQHPCLYDILPRYTRIDKKERALENMTKQTNDSDIFVCLIGNIIVILKNDILMSKR